MDKKSPDLSAQPDSDLIEQPVIPRQALSCWRLGTPSALPECRRPESLAVPVTMKARRRTSPQPSRNLNQGPCTRTGIGHSNFKLGFRAGRVLHP